ncbi:DinB family protein [Luteolibacter sp. GHJ8]|uniref:DinB family protein n=1 Tax=Luteolibacter rhizosphaerae TaxID=2989719 RepID=A0ABT3G806_9BACT|nr:DinB family protein [Luteolibacter rhizosphaerae]MCW1915335.1 DinB family protein [Luteolibacter rhizosphaerae]
MGEERDEEAIQAALEKPGAGLPEAERRVVRMGLVRYAASHDRDAALADFLSGAGAILELVTGLDEARLRRRVLVERVPGMEDSSRYWSPGMIVQHLAIVDRGVLMLVHGLLVGKLPGQSRGPADVKPSPDAGPESLDLFRDTTASWAKFLGKAESLCGTIQHPHPWFGPLDAHHWFCVAVQHHEIHRMQLEAVLASPA